MPIRLPEVVTVTAHGYDALREEIRRGELVRVRPGAYLPAAGRPTVAWRRVRKRVLARCVAVAEKLTTPFAFSHTTAALLHGWDVTLRDEAVHVVQTVNPGRGQAPDVVRHVCTTLDSQEVVLVQGLPVTGPHRTILSCALRLPADDALVVVDSGHAHVADMSTFRRHESEERQAALRERLAAELTALGPARGVRSARAVLALADGFADGPGESRMRWAALAAGLPIPVCQAELWVDGAQYFADAAWRVAGPERTRLVIAEFDGDVKYRGQDGADAVVREKRREDAIRRRHRAEFARLDTPTVNRPERAAQQILDAFPDGYRPTLHPRPDLQVRRSARSGRGGAWS